MDKNLNFDVVKFYEDVVAYGAKYGMGMADISRAIGSRAETLRHNIQQSSLSLPYACKLADFADLPLDRYRGPSEFDASAVSKTMMKRPTVVGLSLKVMSLEERIEKLENEKNT